MGWSLAEQESAQSSERRRGVVTGDAEGLHWVSCVDATAKLTLRSNSSSSSSSSSVILYCSEEARS